MAALPPLETLPPWFRAIAPVASWAECGDLAEATYLGKEEDLTETEGNLLTTLRQKLEERGVNLPVNQDPEAVSLLLRAGKDRESEGKKDLFVGFVYRKYVGQDEQCKVFDLFIAWRGTVLAEEWVVNAAVNLRHWNEANEIEVHTGFCDFYSGIDLKYDFKSLAKDPAGVKYRNIYVTGHSLGAALATLCAYDIAQVRTDRDVKLHLVTFSGPRVASVASARKLNKWIVNHVRLATDGDLVPLVPLYIGAGAAAEKVREGDESGPDETLSKAVDDLKKAVEELGNAARQAEAQEPTLKKAKPDDLVHLGWPLDAIGQALKKVQEATARVLGLCVGVVKSVEDFVLRAVSQTVSEALAMAAAAIKANYHHAGVGVTVSAASLPDKFDQVKWGIVEHHNLTLILYLLLPTKERNKRLLQGLKVPEATPANNLAGLLAPVTATDTAGAPTPGPAN